MTVNKLMCGVKYEKFDSHSIFLIVKISFTWGGFNRTYSLALQLKISHCRSIKQCRSLKLTIYTPAIAIAVGYKSINAGV